MKCLYHYHTAYVILVLFRRYVRNNINDFNEGIAVKPTVCKSVLLLWTFVRNELDSILKLLRMCIWSILLITSDLKWCMHLSRSLISNYYINALKIKKKQRKSNITWFDI